jgi:peptide/nickel transport system ATP-binding protein
MKLDILNIENLTLKIGDKRVLDSVSINIRKGEIFTLVGKSLTALAIMRLLPNGAVVEDGDIIFNSISIFKLPEYRVRELRGSKISMVFQEPMGALNPVIMVGEQVREIIDIHLGDNIDSKERVLELFREVGLNNPEIKYSSYPHQLSGGEKQRVVIAIALACEPQLLIADEPTTALDVTIQAKILNLLEDIQKKRGLSILFITHDMGVVNRISDRVAVMRDGKLLEVSDRVDFFKNPTHPYTKQLIRDFLILKEKKDTRDTTQNILEVKDLKVYFKAKSNFFSRNLKAIKAVDGISFTVQEGKSLAVVGESGSGKSTVAKAILRLIDIDGGDIIFRGESIVDISQKEMLRYRSKIQIIFQDPYSSLNPRMNVGDIIREGMVSLGIAPYSREAQNRIIEELLVKVGLKKGYINRYPHQFSGGERQRINIARALAVKPQLIICDEPTSALDVSVRLKILNLLKSLQDSEGISYLFITHDLSTVPLIADRVLVLNRGRVVEVGSVNEVMNNPKELYTKKLLDSILKVDT